ncbi:M23 family metallopeptidase [Fretibacter rubidus]|uniref:M23 family metallopeptidase n=1 Tax=Fretibacter rubidus TaxID=570162 RepID=UPI00352B3834
MLNDIRDECRSRILHYLPERQIYHRTGGEVHYFVLTTRIQLAVVSTLTVVALWCVLTMGSLILGNNPFSAKIKSSQELQAEFDRRVADAEAKLQNAENLIAQQRQTFEAQTREFAEATDTIAQFVDSTGRSTMQPITAVEYASSRVLMDPRERDVLPRRPRKDLRKMAALEIDTDIDPNVQKLKITQNEILAEAEASTLDRIERNRAIVGETKLSVDTILKNGGFGEGGLFVPMDNDIAKSGSSMANRVASIKARVKEAEALDNAMLSIPFGIPVASDHYRTSAYGMRKDPMNGRPAFHGGVDFGAYRGAEIVATADGIVKFSGRNGGYGKSVEIDHGHGFVTRYAHLDKIHVKRGARVKKGEKIGAMGSTGRSTATHLHYEVFFQGHDYDPDKFLKAGNYVQ